MTPLIAIGLLFLLAHGHGPADAIPTTPSVEPAGNGLDRALLQRDFAALDAAIHDVQEHQATAAAVGAVRGRLCHGDAEVRQLAAYALSQLSLEEARRNIPSLIEAMQDREARVRARVAFALGQIGAAAREAIGVLSAALKDEDPRVRAGAARALGLIGPEAHTALPLLIEALKDDVPPVRGLSAQALGRLGPEARAAAPALRALLTKETDGDVRMAASSALEEIDPTLPMLAAALQDPDPHRRLWAVSVLIQRGSAAKDMLPKLVDVLRQDDDPKVRAAAALALGKMGGAAQSAGPSLAAALQDRSAQVRATAALALGLIGGIVPGAGPALADALTDADSAVADSAATALGNLGPAAETAVPKLINLAKADSLPLRRRAVNALARIGPGARGATEVLRAALVNRDDALRWDAARALVSAGPQAAAPVDALVEALRCDRAEGDQNVRAWACLSLAEIGPPAAPAVPALMQALQDRDINVRTTAVIALARMGAAAVPDLVKALEHVDGQVRAGAAAALGGIGTAARRALGPLREALRDEDSRVSLAAVIALGRIAMAIQLAEDPRARAALEEALGDIDAAQAAGRAGAAGAEWRDAGMRVREAIRSLQVGERSRLIDRLFHNAWFLWGAGIGLYVTALLALWLVLLWLRPLVLLHINDALGSWPPLRLPILLDGVGISPRSLLLVSFFHYHPRVLDAWIAQRVEAFRARFGDQRTVREREVHVPMPVVLDGQVVAVPTPQHLRPTFARPHGCLLICGDHGAGKTSLACQIARWALAREPKDRLYHHVMLPVLIEHDLDGPSSEERASSTVLLDAVRGQLQALAGTPGPISEELLRHLLRQRRVLVIIDHFSEMSAAAREAIRPGHADFPIYALVVTSRCEEVLDGVPRTIVQLQHIEENPLDQRRGRAA